MAGPSLPPMPPLQGPGQTVLTRSQEARLRLRVDFINRIGVNLITFGVVTPTAVLLEPLNTRVGVILGVSWGFVVLGFVLYIYAWRVLGRLD